MATVDYQDGSRLGPSRIKRLDSGSAFLHDSSVLHCQKQKVISNMPAGHTASRLIPLLIPLNFNIKGMPSNEREVSQRPSDPSCQSMPSLKE